MDPSSGALGFVHDFLSEQLSFAVRLVHEIPTDQLRVLGVGAQEAVEVVGEYVEFALSAMMAAQRRVVDARARGRLSMESLERAIAGG